MAERKEKKEKKRKKKSTNNVKMMQMLIKSSVDNFAKMKTWQNNLA